MPSSASSSSTGRPSTSGCATTSRTRTSGSRWRSGSRACTSRGSATAPSAPTSGPFSNAKRVRETLDLLGQLFPYRTCDGPEPGRAVRQPVPRLLHQALPGPVRRLHQRGGLPREHRGDRPLPVGPLPPDRARARAADDRGVRGAGVRAGGGVPQPAARGALAVPAPAHRERVGRHARRARRRGRRHGGQRAGVPGPRRRARRPPELLPGEPRRPQRGRGRGGVRDPVLLDLAVDPGARSSGRDRSPRPRS